MLSRLRDVGQIPRTEDEVLELARRRSTEHTPSVMLAAVRDIYGDSFAARRDEAFELGAVMIGEPELADLSPVYLASEEAIRRLEGKLAALPDELAALARDNAAKGRELERLSGEVESRIGELRARHDRSSTFARMMRALGAVQSFEDAVAGDVELRTLEREKAKIERERIGVETTLIRRNTPRPHLEEDLARLAEAAGALYETLAVDPRPPRHGWLAAASAEARLERRERLLENLESQVAILESMLRDAETLGENLDDLLCQLRGIANEVRGMVDAAREELAVRIGELGLAGGLFETDQSLR